MTNNLNVLHYSVTQTKRDTMLHYDGMTLHDVTLTFIDGVVMETQLLLKDDQTHAEQMDWLYGRFLVSYETTEATEKWVTHKKLSQDAKRSQDPTAVMAVTTRHSFSF